MFESNIRTYLEKYQVLWWYLNDKIDSSEMDVDCEVLEEDDFYGCNFSNGQKVFRLFFTGCDNFFCAIPIYDRDISTINNLDQWPVYCFDLSSDDPLHLVGNFKTFIKQDLCEFIHHCKNRKFKVKPSMYILAINALKEINTYSDNMITMDNYELSMMDEKSL